MDGSIYPRGLAGDSIIRDVRVIAVADIIDAISSHRPYHPALPLDAVRDEILRGRGRQYDTEVVDAALPGLAGP